MIVKLLQVKNQHAVAIMLFDYNVKSCRIVHCREKDEASGISVGGNPPFTLTTELFLDSEPEAKTSHRVSGLPLTGSERNATMADRR